MDSKINGTGNGDEVDTESSKSHDDDNGLRMDVHSRNIDARFHIRQAFFDGMKNWGPSIARWVTWVAIIVGTIAALLGEIEIR